MPLTTPTRALDLEEGQPHYTPYKLSSNLSPPNHKVALNLMSVSNFLQWVKVGREAAVAASISTLPHFVWIPLSFREQPMVYISIGCLWLTVFVSGCVVDMVHAERVVLCDNFAIPIS